MTLTFLPIQPKDIPLAYHFLRDGFRISFGNDPLAWPNNLGQMTEESYRKIIEKKLAIHPDINVHVWENETVIGQIEMSVKKDDPKVGYVNFYYLIPEKRGKGFSSLLDEYATEKLKAIGCSRIELTVEPSNQRAIAFYKKQGWREKGIHPEYGGLVMEKKI